MKSTKFAKPMRRWVAAVLLMVVFTPLAAASTVVNPTELSLVHLLPFTISFLTALLLWKWMIPNQLAGLQVGFEIDDGLYEVHSLSKGKGGVKRLLRLQNVGFGIALYMMAMTGVLLLISELIFEPEVYYLPNLLMMGLLVLIPIIISPWESLNGQLVGKRFELAKKKVFRLFFRRAGTFLGLIVCGLGTYLLLLPRLDDSQKPLAIAISVFCLLYTSPSPRDVP